MLIWSVEICFSLAGKTIGHAAGEYSPNLMMMMMMTLKNVKKGEYSTASGSLQVDGALVPDVVTVNVNTVTTTQFTAEVANIKY